MRAATLALAVSLVGAPAAAQSQDINALSHAVAEDLFTRARAEERDGHTLRAESLYLRALEVDRGVVGAWLGAARLLDARGRRDEALGLLRAVPRYALRAAEARVEVAQALHAAGESDAALSLLREDVSLATLRARVRLCASLGRFPEALAAARRWSELGELSEADRREAAVTARALGRLVAEADAVRYAPDAPALRRLLQPR
jgi:thioredoxin-like negative regulator of GroEL